MRLVVQVRKKVAFDGFTKKMVEQLENNLEEVQGVLVAQFDEKSSKVFLEFDIEDDESENDIERSVFLNAVNKTKHFQFVSLST